MKYLQNVLTGVLLLTAAVAAAQQRPVYPEPKQTVQSRALRAAMPEWQPRNAETVTLPASVDNSKLKYFPAIFNQQGNSCSQASGVRYAYTYQLNRMLERSAESPENTFAYHFTWNFLNEGNDEGSHPYVGYDLMKECGAVSLADMNDESGAVSTTTWLTGYTPYIKAMKYSVEGYEKFTLKTQEGVDRLRRYLYDLGAGEPNGGVATFSCQSSDWKLTSYNGPSQTGIEDIITRVGRDGAHALTIVGYDDTVEFDLDGNGTIDDDERGAFIFVNSWGRWWATDGKCYYPYKYFLIPESEGGLKETDAEACCVTPKIAEPTLVFKINITYTSRNDLYFEMGAADGMDKTTPNAMTTQTSRIVRNQGGDHPMRGEGTLEAFKTIEIALNYSAQYDRVSAFENPKFFLKVRRTAIGNLGSGTLNSFSVVDLKTGTEYPGSLKNVPLNKGEILVSTGEEKQESGVSASPVSWLRPGTYVPYTAPYLVKDSRGKTVKMKIDGYDRANGKISLRYQRLN